MNKLKIKVGAILAVVCLMLSLNYEREVIPEKDIAPHVSAFHLLSMNNGRYATGFHLKYEGKVYLVTNRHVCDANIRVYKHNFIQFDNYIGEIIKIDDLHDLCLVTSNREDGLELADEELKNMDKVYLVGYPRGIGKVIREGHVIEYKDILAPWLDNAVVETQIISTTAYGGNSGSPVVNKRGKVAGVLFAGSRVYHTEAYIVPLSYIKIFLALNVN